MVAEFMKGVAEIQGVSWRQVSHTQAFDPVDWALTCSALC